MPRRQPEPPKARTVRSRPALVPRRQDVHGPLNQIIRPRRPGRSRRPSPKARGATTGVASNTIGFLNEIHAAGVDLYLHQQGLDTTTPSGKAMFGMLGVFAEFERSMIQAPVLAGLARARKHGTKTGNPFGRPRIDAGTEAAIRAALAKGDKGVMKIAAEHGVGTGTVQRIKAEMAAA